MIKDQSNKKDYEGPLYARHPDLVKKDQSSTTSVGVTSSGTSSSANSSVSTN